MLHGNLLYAQLAWKVIPVAACSRSELSGPETLVRCSSLVC